MCSPLRSGFRSPVSRFRFASFAPAQLIRRISRPAPPSELPCGSLSRPFPKVSILPSGQPSVSLSRACPGARLSFPLGYALSRGCSLRCATVASFAPDSSRPTGCLRQATQPAPAGMCSLPVDFATLHPSGCLRQSFSLRSIISPFGLPAAGSVGSLRFQVSGFRFHASGFTLQVSGFTLQVSAFSFLPHVCRIQAHRSRSGYRHGSQRALDLCAGVFYYSEAFLKCLNT